MSKQDVSKPRPDAISLSDEDTVKQVLADAVLELWDIVNNFKRVRPSRCERYRVTIFGSARAQPGTFASDETKRIATTLTELGCGIITGERSRTDAGRKRAGGQRRLGSMATAKAHSRLRQAQDWSS